MNRDDRISFDEFSDFYYRFPNAFPWLRIVDAESDIDVPIVKSEPRVRTESRAVAAISHLSARMQPESFPSRIESHPREPETPQVRDDIEEQIHDVSAPENIREETASPHTRFIEAEEFSGMELDDNPIVYSIPVSNSDAVLIRNSDIDSFISLFVILRCLVFEDVKAAILEISQYPVLDNDRFQK